MFNIGCNLFGTNSADLRFDLGQLETVSVDQSPSSVLLFINYPLLPGLFYKHDVYI